MSGSNVGINGLKNNGTLPDGNNISGTPKFETYAVPITGIGSNGNGFAARTGTLSATDPTAAGNFFFDAGNQQNQTGPPVVEGLNTNANFSVFTRFKLDSLSDFTVLSGRPAGRVLSFIRNTGKLDFFIQGAGDIFNGNAAMPTIATNTWYDIGYSFTGTGNDGIGDTVKYYVNGVNIAASTGANTLDTADVFHFGSKGNNVQAADALFDRVSFYDEVLTDSEFAAFSVPEPSSMLLSATAMLGLLIRRRR